MTTVLPLVELFQFSRAQLDLREKFLRLTEAYPEGTLEETYSEQNSTLCIFFRRANRRSFYVVIPKSGFARLTFYGPGNALNHVQVRPKTFSRQEETLNKTLGLVGVVELVSSRSYAHGSGLTFRRLAVKRIYFRKWRHSPSWRYPGWEPASPIFPVSTAPDRMNETKTVPLTDYTLFKNFRCRPVLKPYIINSVKYEVFRTSGGSLPDFIVRVVFAGREELVHINHLPNLISFLRETQQDRANVVFS